jgi:hypothetical protein
MAVPLALIALAGCARSEDASVRPGNESYSAVEQVRSGDDEQEPALGEWRRSLQEEQPALEFGPAGTAPLMSIVCGERGGLILQRPGAVASGAAPMMSVTVGGQGRQLPVSSVPGMTPMQRSSIAPGDTLLTQLAGAQAPIALRFGDGTPLILPQSPLIGEFVQSCATGPRPGRTAAGSTAGGNESAAEAPAGNASNAAAPSR